jgi:hypothetical protein
VSDATARACDEPGCSEPVARRCYFCERSFCRSHGTVTAAGAICETCAGRERQKQEERQKQAEEHAARAKGSGCLVALVLLGPVLLCRVRQDRSYL